jgi:hypothetical protein
MDVIQSRAIEMQEVTTSGTQGRWYMPGTNKIVWCRQLTTHGQRVNR